MPNKKKFTPIVGYKQKGTIFVSTIKPNKHNEMLQITEERLELAIKIALDVQESYRDELAKSLFKSVKSLSTVEDKDESKHNQARKALMGMLGADNVLYEKILDTPKFAYHFNQLVRLASN